MDKRSFSRKERNLRGEFRTKINTAESTEDVKKFLGQTALKDVSRSGRSMTAVPIPAER